MSEIIGEAYRELKKLVKQYAEKDIPVLLVGESGTGKELFAQLYMDENKRQGKKLTVNCSAIIPTLLSSEIFGHVKGAFTDAKEKRKGKLETCHKGILFLDELGTASLEFQAAILRVTEENSYSPVGSDEEKKCDVRIIAATSNLSNIRDDLKQRFNCLPVPPLQRFDIPKIAEKYLGRPLKESIVQELMSKEYPGNVRQLQGECKQLNAERGEKIFGTRPYQEEYQSFDYNRFRFESELWSKYIQPIIDKNKINDLKYTIVNDNRKGYKLTPVTRELEWGQIVDAILKLRDGGIFDIATLVENLRRKISDGGLPYLLDMLNDRINPSPIHTRVEFPDFTRLLGHPFEKACELFKVIYLEYYVKKYGDITSAANALDIPVETFRSRLRRAREAIKDNTSN